MYKERYLVFNHKYGYYNGTDVVDSDRNVVDAIDLTTEESDDAKRFDKYEEADSFIKLHLPDGIWQIVKVVIKGE